MKISRKRARVDFLCPRCGGSTWGTSGMWDSVRNRRAPFSKWIGHCQGTSRCGFSWARKNDWKVMRAIVHPTKEEYEALRKLDDSDEKLTVVIRPLHNPGGVITGPAGDLLARKIPGR